MLAIGGRCTVNTTMTGRGIVRTGDLSGLKRALARARDGEKLTVAYLGGSVTQGAGAGRQELCYASRVTAWLAERYPLSRTSMINAGIGATTSQYGAARVQEDVLARRPDIVLVEYAVNDPQTELFAETFEGVVRRILSAPWKPALLVLYNVCYDTGDSAQELHERIAAHYNLPAVSVRDSVYRDIAEGKLTESSLTADHLHPNDLGHEYIAQIVEGLLMKAEEAPLYGSATEELLPAPVTPNGYERARRYRNDTEGVVTVGFVADETVPLGIWDCFRGGYTGRRPGDAVTVPVEGRRITIAYRKTVKRPAPKARVTVDGTDCGELDAAFMETWGDLLALQTIYEGTQSARRTVRVEITQGDDGTGRCASFDLIGIICAD